MNINMYRALTAEVLIPIVAGALSTGIASLFWPITDLSLPMIPLSVIVGCICAWCVRPIIPVEKRLAYPLSESLLFGGFGGFLGMALAITIFLFINA